MANHEFISDKIKFSNDLHILKFTDQNNVIYKKSKLTFLTYFLLLNKVVE